MAKKAALTLSPETLSAVKRLGESLRIARIRRRLTQAQLATRAGIGVSTIQRLERGDAGLGLGSVLEVLAVLERGWLEALIDPVHADDPGRALERRRLPTRVVNRHDDF